MSDIVSCTVPISGSNETLYFKDANLRNELTNVGDYIGYYPLKGVVGLHADFVNSTFTRLGDAVGLNAGSDFDRFPMYGGRRLCNLADDGTVNAWYEDLTYTEDGSNGQVMVWQPKFYYKVVPIEKELITETGHDCEGYHLLKADYYISDFKWPGFKIHPAFLDPNGNEMDGIYISAYEGSIYDVSESKYLVYDDMSDDGNYTLGTYIADDTVDKMCSISGVKPASGNKHVLSARRIESMCLNRGLKWHSENAQVVSMEQLLMVIEYSMFNMQTAIGDGVTNISSTSVDSCSVQTGATSSIGNGTGVATTTTRYISTGATTYTATDGTDKLSIRYRGRENDWGNVYKIINGLNILGNSKKRGGIPYYCDDFDYEDSKSTENYKTTGITITNANEYIKYFGYSNDCDWGFFPTLVGNGANSSTPVGDYIYVTSNLNNYRMACFGGAWLNTTIAGSFSWHCHYSVGTYSRGMGARIMCLGPTSNN